MRAGSSACAFSSARPNCSSPSLRGNDAAPLVLIRGAQISSVEPFQSRSGLNHLRFRLSAGGATYAAIAYQNDWTPDTRRALESGKVDAAGL